MEATNLGIQCQNKSPPGYPFVEEITSAYDLTIKPHSQCLNQFPRSTESSLGAQHDAISESFSMAPVGLFLFLDGCVISLFTNPSIMYKAPQPGPASIG